MIKFGYVISCLFINCAITFADMGECESQAASFNQAEKYFYQKTDRRVWVCKVDS